MEIIGFETISDIIKKEKFTNNIIFTLKLRGHDIETLSLRHSSCLYNLLKLFSISGFFMELEEPSHIAFEKDDIISSFLDDLIVYSKYLQTEFSDLLGILSILIDIKANLLKLIIFDEVHNFDGSRTNFFMEKTSEDNITLTKGALEKYNGQTNKPAYVAIDNKIYDISSSPAWKNGKHFGVVAGNDLTEEFLKCHKNREEILSKISLIGYLSEG